MRFCKKWNGVLSCFGCFGGGLFLDVFVLVIFGGLSQFSGDVEQRQLSYT